MTFQPTNRANQTEPTAAGRSKIISVTVEGVIAAAPERVWAVLADGFGAVGDWASTVERSTPWSDASGRTCEVPGFGQTQERVTALDPVDRTIAYSVEAEKTPGFLRAVETTWRVTPLDSAGSQVALTIDARVGGAAGRLLAPVLRMQFRRTQRRVLADLDVYARTGTVSDRKAKLLAGEG